MTTGQLNSQLGLEVLTADSGKDIASCYISDLLSHVMGSCREGDVWITVQTSMNMIAVALMIDAACVILAEGVTAPDDVIAKAKEEGLTLFSSKDSAYVLAAKIAKLLGDI